VSTPSTVPPPLRIALAQLKPRKADLRGNLAAVREAVAEESGRTDVVVFPESALSGYFLEGGVHEVALSAERLADLLGPPPPEAPDVALGFYERWRRRLYNSAAWLTPEEGRWRVLHVHRKMFLPTYGVFDEDRFVEAGTDLRAFDTRFGRVGLLVCEEMWHSMAHTVLALGGAELLVVVSASPARDFSPTHEGLPENLARWDRLARSAAQEHGVFVAVSQLAGSEGGKVFSGGSLVVAPDGAVLARGPLFEEGVIRATLEPAAIDRARAAAPLLADLETMLPHLERSLRTLKPGRSPADEPGRDGEGVGTGTVPHLVEAAGRREPAPLAGGGGAPPPLPHALRDPMELDVELVRRTLVEFIREEFQRRRGFERAVVGVSGGVDSAVSLYLACEALGAGNVHGFRLPYRTSSPESLEHAAMALEATGAHGRTIDISDAVDRYVEEHEPDVSDLRKGNLMARIRAVVLFDQSAKLDALPLGTGNKSERLLGYFTWHADDSPPINPLGDLFKTQVWALARHLGVPEEIVEKPATADLVKGVTDEDELGFGYHQADPVLHALLAGRRPEEVVAMGFDEEAVGLVHRRLQSTHWKRELPTVALLSSSAIGAFYLRPVDY
jgi:NAD+ synthetase